MAISLSSISRTTRNSLPPRVVVHGDGGVGKSTFAAGAYKPVFLPFEDGLSGLEVDAFPLLRSYQEAVDALAALASEQHDYGTVVVDSLDWLEPLVWEKVARDHGKKSIEEIPYGKGYAEALPLWRTLLDGLNHLRETRGMAIILIAHSQIKRFEAPDSEPFDRYEIKLHRGAGAMVREWADIIGFATTRRRSRRTPTASPPARAAWAPAGVCCVWSRRPRVWRRIATPCPTCCPFRGTAC
jgi:hypothetical protein